MNTHKMRMIISLLFFGIIAMAAASCSQNAEQDDAKKGPELVFSTAPVSRATVNYPIERYFTDNNEISVFADGISMVYEYADGYIVAPEGQEIYFPAANVPLQDVTLSWPVDYIYNPNQSDEKDFLANDYLVCYFTDLMPSAVVPAVFSHINYKITFTLGGVDYGKKIESLSVTDDTNTYRAYCDPNSEIHDAQLILPPGKDLGNIIGNVTLEDMTYSFLIPQYMVPEIGMLNQNITVTIIR